MSVRHARQRMSNRWRRIGALRGDQRGVSAVEFALLLPLMIALYLGCVEVSQGVAVDRKVTLTARTRRRPGGAGRTSINQRPT